MTLTVTGLVFFGLLLLSMPIIYWRSRHSFSPAS
jgi:hypothetical protein